MFHQQPIRRVFDYLCTLMCTYTSVSHTGMANEYETKPIHTGMCVLRCLVLSTHIVLSRLNSSRLGAMPCEILFFAILFRYFHRKINYSKKNIAGNSERIKWQCAAALVCVDTGYTYISFLRHHFVQFGVCWTISLRTPRW